MKDKKVSNFESIDEVEFTLTSDVWTRENLFKVTKLFQQTGNEECAVNILEKLLKINISEVPSLVEKHQMTIVFFINQCPSEILRMLINKYFLPQLTDDNLTLLLTTGRAIPVALTRRLYKSPIVETIASIVIHFIKCPEVITELEHKLKEEDSQRRFEIHSVTKAVLLESNENNFHFIENLVDKLIKELDGDDILSSLAALTILTEITSERETAAVYLGQKGLIDKIYKCLIQMENDKDNSFLYFGYIKFFGHLVSVNSDYLKKYPVFVRLILKMFQDFDKLGNDQKILTISTFGAIFHSSQSKKLLFEIDEIKNNLPDIMPIYTNFLIYGNMETKIHVLDSLVMIFQNFFLKDTFIFEELLDLCGPSFTTTLLDILKSPFESKLAALHFLQIITEVVYGFKKIYFTPTFMEYLLDKKTETNLIGMQTKNNIICNIIEKYNDIVGEENIKKLKDSIKYGSSYIEKTPDVAVME
ncbi:26S proteasome non-ATPase regulatory subunit 5 [Strongyloides ratti]|uniref:26S proteasome non-ATPase regulatory subunit 5 n=1 Tax=Strongyloides ratti TaxID=34506 RepID=A0A090L6C6_STRRB|nr:26S proteasome non-ATPase regulatory subunit 5 [Strongyloides ratti]CEF63064.1 26S proteasome non-ATPase regulatory subunit 5 [Strongyloides ratti]